MRKTRVDECSTQAVVTSIFDHLSENSSSSHNLRLKKKILSIICICPRNGSPKFRSSVVSSSGITALESRKNKEIDLYSDYAKNKL